MILGGGVSKEPERFMPYLELRRGRIVPAALGNAAGVVGAALHAQERGLVPARTRARRRRVGAT